MLNSSIEWTDDTANFWEGCTQVSPACDFCYAMKRAHRYAKLKDGTPNPNGVEWNGPPVKRKAGIANLRQANRRAKAEGRTRLVFINSLSDTFDKNADPAWRAEMFAEIRAARHIHAMILTKRIGNAAAMISDAGGWPENASLGATFCNQAEVNRDMGKLLAAKSVGGIKLVFASIEPMLEPITLFGWLGPGELDYVIVGGESGPEARPMHPEWARNLRDECANARVAFMFKQWGEYAPALNGRVDLVMARNGVIDRNLPSQMEGGGERPRWSAMARAGKTDAGRMLDGRTHDDRLPIGRHSEGRVQ